MTFGNAAEPLDRLVPVSRLRPVGDGRPENRSAVAHVQLDALAAVVEDLAGHFELQPLLERILRRAVGLLGCENGSICTVDEPAGTYRKEIDLGVACRSGQEFPLTEGVTGEIMRAGGPVTFAEYAQVRGGHIAAADRVRLHAVIGVPIRWAGAVIGSCIVFSRDPDRRFGLTDVTLLELFAGHAGVALANARMHAQAAELARAEAAATERERVVRDVHDSVARAVASVLLHLGSAGSTAPAGLEPGRDRLDLARQAAASALSETRRTVLGVRPPATSIPTLAEAIEAQVEWARGSGLDIALVVAGRPRVLPAPIIDELFGLAHQAIANTVSHSGARTARVGLVYSASEVVLLIQDDGTGFDAAELPRPDGSGGGWTGPGLAELTEIAGRAERLGGSVRIDATPGWGTTIRAAMPYLAGELQPGEPESGVRRTVLIVDHRPLVRAGLVSLLAASAPAIQVIGEIDDPADALEAYRMLGPDVVLVDLALVGGAAGLIAALRAVDPAVAVVVIGDAGRSLGLIQAGARAVVTLDADGSAVGRAIGAAARGETWVGGGIPSGAATPVAGRAALTVREDEVRALVSRGLPDKQIAARLRISVKTVEKHVGAALRKTGARNRTELAGLSHFER